MQLNCPGSPLARTQKPAHCRPPALSLHAPSPIPPTCFARNRLGLGLGLTLSTRHDTTRRDTTHQGECHRERLRVPAARPKLLSRVRAPPAAHSHRLAFNGGHGSSRSPSLGARQDATIRAYDTSTAASRAQAHDAPPFSLSPSASPRPRPASPAPRSAQPSAVAARALGLAATQAIQVCEDPGPGVS